MSRDTRGANDITTCAAAVRVGCGPTTGQKNCRCREACLTLMAAAAGSPGEPRRRRRGVHRSAPRIECGHVRIYALAVTTTSPPASAWLLARGTGGDDRGIAGACTLSFALDAGMSLSLALVTGPVLLAEYLLLRPRLPCDEPSADHVPLTAARMESARRDAAHATPGRRTASANSSG